MRSTIICAAILSAIAIPAAVVAQAAAPAVKTGMMIISADGKRIGRIYDLDKSSDGAIKSVVVIRDAKLIRISAATLTPAEKGLTTTLSIADVSKLK